MRIRQFVFSAAILVALSFVPARAQERITLDAAIKVNVDNGATIWRVGSLFIQRSPAVIQIVLYEADGSGAFVTTGRRASFGYDDDATTADPAPSGTTTSALIGQLNTANLTTTSLEKRIIQRLQTDGRLGTGTISGTP